MGTEIIKKIREMVDLETKGWDTKNPDLFLSMIHPDMAWPFPPTADAHDPIDWVFVMGRFNKERWRKNWQELFDAYDLVHNNRNIVKIEISQEQDAAFAVVDIDTLWRHKITKEESHWKGRVCKIYTKLGNGRMEVLLPNRGSQFPAPKERLTAACR